MKSIKIGLFIFIVSFANAVFAFQAYGPIVPGDTLWSIANQHRLKGVSTSQMIDAIKIANPHALGGANDDVLRKGATLQIPSTVGEVQATLGQASSQAAG